LYTYNKSLKLNKSLFLHIVIVKDKIKLTNILT